MAGAAAARAGQPGDVDLIRTAELVARGVVFGGCGSASSPDSPATLISSAPPFSWRASGFNVPAFWIALGASLAIYLAVLVVAALRGRESGDPILLTVAAFVGIHLGYGIGMWQAVFGLVARR